MKFQVVISTRAMAELQSAAEWWAENHEPEQAARWFVGFDARIRGLGDSPHRCPIAAENESIPYEIRQLNFGLSSRPTHRAIFTIVEPDIVVILTIRHMSRDRIAPDDMGRSHITRKNSS